MIVIYILSIVILLFIGSLIIEFYNNEQLKKQLEIEYNKLKELAQNDLKMENLKVKSRVQITVSNSLFCLKGTKYLYSKPFDAYLSMEYESFNYVIHTSEIEANGYIRATIKSGLFETDKNEFIPVSEIIEYKVVKANETTND